MAGNPFLNRVSDRGMIGHGRVSEKRVAKSMGAQLHPASGAMRGAKSDASMKEENFRLEMKSTTSQSLSIEMGWLTKISKEAVVHGQYPGVVISFVDQQGKPVMQQNAEWVMMPLQTFKELAGRG